MKKKIYLLQEGTKTAKYHLGWRVTNFRTENYTENKININKLLCKPSLPVPVGASTAPTDHCMDNSIRYHSIRECLNQCTAHTKGPWMFADVEICQSAKASHHLLRLAGINMAVALSTPVNTVGADLPRLPSRPPLTLPLYV